MAKLNGQVTGSALESSRVRIDVLGCALSGSTSTAFNSRVTHSLGHSASHNPRRHRSLSFTAGGLWAA